MYCGNNSNNNDNNNNTNNLLTLEIIQKCMLPKTSKVCCWITRCAHCVEVRYLHRPISYNRARVGLYVGYATPARCFRPRAPSFQGFIVSKFTPLSPSLRKIEFAFVVVTHHCSLIRKPSLDATTTVSVTSQFRKFDSKKPSRY